MAALKDRLDESEYAARSPKGMSTQSHIFGFRLMTRAIVCRYMRRSMAEQLERLQAQRDAALAEAAKLAEALVEASK